MMNRDEIIEVLDREQSGDGSFDPSPAELSPVIRNYYLKYSPRLNQRLNQLRAFVERLKFPQIF